MPFGTLPSTTNDAITDAGQQADVSVLSELERAREELELVSYVTSHDLQAPLRTILAVCDEINEHPENDINKPEHIALRRISREAVRMKVLMNGLLDYIRLETYGPSQNLIDSNEIMEVALTMLEEKIRTSLAKITYDNLPHVYAHRGRLTRLFVNLIDNALKFTEATPIIHISAFSNAQGAKFIVTDNGIGIEEEYHTIIFQLFQRLHTSEAYPGEGIGLALSRKIVESFGGKIWVESSPKHGCKIQFTIPNNTQDLAQESI